MKPPSKSLFRPRTGVDQGFLQENRRLIEQIDRRNVLRGSLSLGALTLLSGCDVSENAQLQTVLRAVSDWNDRVQAFIFHGPVPDGCLRYACQSLPTFSKLSALAMVKRFKSGGIRVSTPLVCSSTL